MRYFFFGVVADDVLISHEVGPRRQPDRRPCLEVFVMSRFVCLALALSALTAAPGCSSCFGGGNNCRRPSFMEFRSPCGQRAAPGPVMGAPCGPVCDPCSPGAGPMMGPAPCCDEGMMQGGMGMPAAPRATDAPGTFS